MFSKFESWLGLWEISISRVEDHSGGSGPSNGKEAKDSEWGLWGGSVGMAQVNVPRRNATILLQPNGSSRGARSAHNVSISRGVQTKGRRGAWHVRRITSLKRR